MSNSRLKLFLENFLFYGGLTVLSKIIPFVLLPVITRLIPKTSDYGVADMFTVVSNFGVSFAVLGLYDAMFREFFEDENNKEYQRRVTSTASCIVFLSGLTIFLLTCLFPKLLAEHIFSSYQYSSLIILTGLAIMVGALYKIVQAPTRMRNQRKVFLFTSLLLPIVSYSTIMFFVCRGFTYMALVYGTLILSLTGFLIFYYLNRFDFNPKYFDWGVAKELFKIGLPLLPTFIIYWVFASMDRIMISKMIGNSELGVYSVGARIAGVSQLVYIAFSSGWQYFSFSTMKDEDQVELNSKVFEYLSLFSFIIFIISLPMIQPIFTLLFRGNYVRGAEVFPYLFLSPLLLMLFQTLANQALIVKKSYYSTISLSLGAVLNVTLNYILIGKYGIRGAALSTLISYLISIIILIFYLKKLNLENISIKFYANLTAISFVIYSLFVQNPIMLKASSLIFIILCLSMYMSKLLGALTFMYCRKK